MTLLKHETFICLDCETTGLDPEKDRIIELAATKFTFEKMIDNFETLINPECSIPIESQNIHHIDETMVKDKPKIEDVLPHFLKFLGSHIIVGHGIGMDLSFLQQAAKRHQIPCNIASRTSIDTLRLARLYGDSPSNSLQTLRQHFNIQEEDAHRAMSDVIVNIEVFKFLSAKFKTTQDLLNKLNHPVLLKKMPLGKHKGRLFSEIPIEYLRWAICKDFDQDLMFSIKTELKKRKSGNQFKQISNPFADL